MNKPPGILKFFFPSITWHKGRREKNLYITFDDGPNPISTPWILNTLTKYNAKASFFCLGEDAEKYPEFLREITKNGHTLGNHGYAHVNGWKTSTKAYLDNFNKAHTLLQTKLFRPPYGKLKVSQFLKIKSMNSIIMWEYLSVDYKQHIDLTHEFDKMKRNITNGSIIVFHDSEKAFSNMQYLLTQTLTHFSSKSYNFLPL